MLRPLAFGLARLVLVSYPLRGHAQDHPIAFVHARLLTMEGPEIPDGTLVVQNGKILAVGASAAISKGAEIRDMRGRVIMPGLVDSHSHIGGAEGADGTAPIQPEVRVADALNLRSATLMRARAGGLTTVNVMPGSGHLLSGQTYYLKLREGRTLEALAVERHPDGSFLGGLKMANGTNSRREGGAQGFPGTRAKSAALVREQFIKAQEYGRKRQDPDPTKRPERNLGLEILLEVLDGRRVVHHHTHRHDDIGTVLRLQKEFGFKVVLHHLSEGWAVAEDIAKSGAPCSVILVDSPGGKLEARDMRLSTSAALAKAGALVGFHTDDPINDSRWFNRSAALAVRGGLGRDTALKGLTLNNARILGLEHRLGSLKVGKDADLAILDGDPLLLRTQVLETWVEGRKVFDRSDPAQRIYALGGPGAAHDQGDPGGLLAMEGAEL